MIEHLKQKYLEEANDLLLELENTLLLLEENPTNPEGAETAFRVMHTLKGSSGMFGYQQISELVHLLENGYDSIRSAKLPVPGPLVSLSLESVDHIRALLQEGSIHDPEVQAVHKGLLKRAAELLYDVVEVPVQAAENIKSSGLSTWAILFIPAQNLLRNGSNPLYVLEELAGLGQLQSFMCANALPDLSRLNPQDCWISWLLLLATEATEEAVREAFLFVEDACQLEIKKVCAGNLLPTLDAQMQENISSKLAKGLDAAVFAEQVELLLVSASPASAKNPQPIAEGAGTAGLSEVLQPALFGKEKGAATIRVASDKLDDLMNLISELVANQERLSLLAGLSTMPELSSVAEEIEKITRQLRDKTFDICLVPIGSLLTRFKRLVRDLSQELNKNIVFEAEGVETELDKNVVEGLSECLVHIFRNSIDHGLEDEAERIAKGKPAQGRLLLKAYNSGTNVIIEMQDDGRGIDPEKIRNKAVEKGLLHKDQLLTEQDMLELIFLPGFSTAQGVTAVSGRGVGMDVVRKKIKELRGEVKIRNKKGYGTTVSISLPLTISILDGLLVRVGETDFVLPLSFVEKSYSVTAADLDAAINNQLILDKEPIIYFNLAEAFSFGSLRQSAFGVVIRTGPLKVVLLVDEIIGEYQAVLKPLGKFYQEQDFLSGGSLKGDGTVALVLDPQKLIEEISKNTSVHI